MIYQALNATSNFGFSLIGNHQHCQFPATQGDEIVAFYNKLRQKSEASTGIFRTEIDVDISNYVGWEVPVLL
jgi:hypothetical protein